jgi:hypothetical protein
MLFASCLTGNAWSLNDMLTEQGLSFAPHQRRHEQRPCPPRTELHDCQACLPAGPSGRSRSAFSARCLGTASLTRAAWSSGGQRRHARAALTAETLTARAVRASGHADLAAVRRLHGGSCRSRLLPGKALERCGNRAGRHHAVLRHAGCLGTGRSIRRGSGRGCCLARRRRLPDDERGLHRLRDWHSVRQPYNDVTGSQLLFPGSQWRIWTRMAIKTFHNVHAADQPVHDPDCRANWEWCTSGVWAHRHLCSASLSHKHGAGRRCTARAADATASSCI